MKCQKCGFENKDGSKFCLKCGNKILAEEIISLSKSESVVSANVPEQMQKTVLSDTDENINLSEEVNKPKGKKTVFITAAVSAAVIGICVGIIAVKNNSLDNDIAVTEITDSYITQIISEIHEKDETTSTSVNIPGTSDDIVGSAFVETVFENGFDYKTEKTISEISIQQASPYTDVCETTSIPSSIEDEIEKSKDVGNSFSISLSEATENNAFDTLLPKQETIISTSITTAVSDFTETAATTTPSSVPSSAITSDTTAAMTTKAVLTSFVSSVATTVTVDSGSFIESRKNQKYK